MFRKASELYLKLAKLQDAVKTLEQRFPPGIILLVKDLPMSVRQKISISICVFMIWQKYGNSNKRKLNKSPTFCHFASTFVLQAHFVLSFLFQKTICLKSIFLVKIATKCKIQKPENPQLRVSFHSTN